MLRSYLAIKSVTDCTRQPVTWQNMYSREADYNGFSSLFKRGYGVGVIAAYWSSMNVLLDVGGTTM